MWRAFLFPVYTNLCYTLTIQTIFSLPTRISSTKHPRLKCWWCRHFVNGIFRGSYSRTHPKLHLLCSVFFIKCLYSINCRRYLGQCFIFASFSVAIVWYLYGMKGDSRIRAPICNIVLMEQEVLAYDGSLCASQPKASQSPVLSCKWDRIYGLFKITHIPCSKIVHNIYSNNYTRIKL